LEPGGLGIKLPQLIPILTTLTARVAGQEMAQLLQSPTALARALADTQKVVGHDGVLCLFDPLLLSSACTGKQGEVNPPAGPQGMDLTTPDEVLRTAPVASLLEAIQPLRHHLPDSAMIFATFAGPELLYSQLQSAFESCGMTGGADSDYVLDVIRNVVRSSFEMKADGIALIEQTAPGTPAELQRCHKTVRKLAEFYDAAFLAFRWPGSQDREPDIAAHCVFDLAIPDESFGLLRGRPGPSVASPTPPVTTTGDVPENMPIERLKALLQEGPAV